MVVSTLGSLYCLQSLALAFSACITGLLIIRVLFYTPFSSPDIQRPLGLFHLPPAVLPKTHLCSGVRLIIMITTIAELSNDNDNHVS